MDSKHVEETSPYYWGLCRYPEAPSSLNESLVAAPPPGEVVGGWLTLLEVSLSCHGPSCLRSLHFWNHPSTETDHCRSPRAWPSWSNLGPFARAVLAPGLFVWLAEPAILPGAVHFLPLPHFTSFLPLPHVFIPGLSLINILYAKLSLEACCSGGSMLYKRTKAPGISISLPQS